MLKQISEDVFYIPGVVNIGVVKDGRTAILIDTGLDDDTARKILNVLKKHDLRPKAIINTHSHADHCGGNSYVQGKTDALIYASEIEAEIIKYPYLEPFCLFSGATPIEDLRNKFLMAKPSRVDYVIGSEKKLAFDNVEVEVVPLPGHSPNQIGIAVEGVLFCADAIFSKDILTKYKIPFHVDIAKQKETLEFLMDCGYGYCLPSHAELTKDIADLAYANLRLIEDIENNVLEILKDGKTTESVLKELCNLYGIKIKSCQQFHLLKTATMAYLSSLHRCGKLEIAIAENTLYWRSA